MARAPGTDKLDGAPAGKPVVSPGADRATLARHRLQQRSPASEMRNGFPLFAVSPGSALLTLDRVKRHE